MTGVSGGTRGRAGRLMLGIGLALALAATAALVISEDTRWLRLGIVAALWAGLLGGFLATRYRRQAEEARESFEEAKAVYELELEREVAARREYELELENELRGKTSDDARHDMDALRSEVAALRETLQKLFNGEVLYERVALTAQSTRMRSLSDESPMLSSGRDSASFEERPPQLIAGARARDDLAEQRTELISRVLAADFAARHPQPPREHGVPRGYEKPARPPRDPKTARDRGRPDFVRAPESSRPAEPPRPPEPPLPPEPRRQPVARRQPETAAPSAASELFSPHTDSANRAPTNGTWRPEPAVGSANAHENGSHAASRRDDAAAGPDRSWTPSWEDRPEPAANGLFTAFTEAAPTSRHGENRYETDSASESGTSLPSSNSTLPASALDIQHQGKPTGRRRKPEEPRGDGGFDPPDSPSGRHSRARPEPAPAEDTTPSGSHASGRSVNDLLAAYGAAADSPRRRRRRD